MNEIALPGPSPQVLTAMEVALAFIVDGPDSFQRADGACVELLQLKHEIQDKWRESKKKADEVHASICKMERDELGQVDAVRAHYKLKMAAWREAEETKRLAAEAIAREQAKKAFDSLAVDLAKSVEEKGGDGISILDKMMKATPVVHIKPPVPNSRTRMRELWEIESIDEAQLPEEYWVPDRQAIAAVVRAKKCEHPIPGVTAKPRPF